jgi:hypothetical protein
MLRSAYAMHGPGAARRGQPLRKATEHATVGTAVSGKGTA